MVEGMTFGEKENIGENSDWTSEMKTLISVTKIEYEKEKKKYYCYIYNTKLYKVHICVVFSLYCVPCEMLVQLLFPWFKLGQKENKPKSDWASV